MNEENITNDAIGALVQAQDEYIKLLSEELADVMPIAEVHHYRTQSGRIDAGAVFRRKIAELRSKANIEA